MSDDQSFLNRWSRLKRRVSLEQHAPSVSTVPQQAAPLAPPPEADRRPTEPGPVEVSSQKPAEEEAIDLSKLPPIESLGTDSDYSVFMRKGVPEDLRMKALRRMWMTDPVLAGPEVLDMYAWDYTGVDGHKPLARPVIEAIAASAKAIKEAVGDSTKNAEGRSDSSAVSAAAAPQHGPASGDRQEDTGSKSG